MAREQEEALLEAFNKAAADVTESDRAERERLLEVFSLGELRGREPQSKPRRELE